jgi:AraC-like DNA-binding protein
MILQFNKIPEYCKGIGIYEPNHSDFDIRRFEINMETVKTSMPAFQHRFFAIALKLEGSGIAKLGHKIEQLNGAYFFFNSPYQILSWEIDRDWKGFYIMFTEQFLHSSSLFRYFLTDFPFLRLDKTMPIPIENENDRFLFIDIFERIFKEYYSQNPDKFDIIKSYVNTILLYIKRFFTHQTISSNSPSRNADIQLLSRFQHLIETSFYENSEMTEIENPHSVSFYADKLNVHPNHLNSIIKSITGNTASQMIQQHIINLAKSYILQTDLNIKEIAYKLKFEEQSHFNSFFRKYSKSTPSDFRKNNL